MAQDVTTQVDIFFSRYPEQKKKKGTILIQPDDPANTLYYLRQGVVKQYTISPEGEESTVNLFKQFAYFPMYVVVTDLHHKHFFESITDITYNAAPANEVYSFLKTKPDILLDLLRRMFIGIDGLMQRFEYAMAANSRTKTVYTILNAAYRFGEKTPNGTHIPIRITHKELATMAGTTRETLSREIKKLENEGIIKIEENQIIIPDEEKLKSLLTE